MADPNHRSSDQSNKSSGTGTPSQHSSQSVPRPAQIQATAQAHTQAQAQAQAHATAHAQAQAQAQHTYYNHNYNPHAHTRRRLRSQYPRRSTERHVEYILVASFDIDKGPIMEHQFPMAITGDEHMLAELMLPDQTHLRNQDWTMFFLHKNISQEEEEQEHLAKAARRRRRRRRRRLRQRQQRRQQRRARRLAEQADGGTGDDWDDLDAGEFDDDDDDFDDNDDDIDNELEEDEEAEDDDDDEEEDDDDVDDDDDESTDSEPEGGEGAPLIYVLNLVNTKQDKTVKRGAVVKAMAICTRHPFLHIYKPLLLLALEEYFKSPVPETLAMLYDAVNAMDLSLMPRLSLLEGHLLQASDNKDLFVDKFEQMIQMRMAEEAAAAAGVEGKVNGGDEEVDSQGNLDTTRSPTNGGRPFPSGNILRVGTKAHFEGQSSLSASAAAVSYSVPRDTHEFESKVFYKGIPIPVKVPVAIMPETVGDFSLIKLIQNFSDTHAKAPQPFPLHAHLTTNGAHTHPIIVLVNALLTQKRVIFLGHNMPSGDVAEAVLAACALASGGVLRGFTRHAFPYTDLTKIDDLLLVPGFIAGVTNPTFELHPEWWDLLCDLPSGRVKISSRIEEAPATDGLVFFRQQYPACAHLTALASTAPSSSSSSKENAANSDLTGDNAFMADILKSIQARVGERVIRAKWRDWVVKFTRIAAAYEESVYGASLLTMGSSANNGGGAASAPPAGSAIAPPHDIDPLTPLPTASTGHGYVWADETAKQRELAGNVTRIEGWRNTRSYASFIKDVTQLYAVRPLKGMDLHHMHDSLRTQRLSAAQTRDIFLTLAHSVHSYDEICLLLTVAPESHGGLFYVALGLFHKDRDVRIKTAELMERIGEHEAGRHWWRVLSRFEKLAFVRIRREAEADLHSKLEREREAAQLAVGGANYRGHVV